MNTKKISQQPKKPSHPSPNINAALSAVKTLQNDYALLDAPTPPEKPKKIDDKKKVEANLKKNVVQVKVGMNNTAKQINLRKEDNLSKNSSLKNEKKIELNIKEENKMELDENLSSLDASFSIEQIFKRTGTAISCCKIKIFKEKNFSAKHLQDFSSSFPTPFLNELGLNEEKINLLSQSQINFYYLLLEGAIDIKSGRIFRFEKSNKKLLKKIEDLSSFKELYTDKKFPPNNSSISLKSKSDSFWRRASEFIDKEKLVLLPTSTSILPPVQGTLGDCYLIATLLCLCSFPTCIARLFINGKNEKGIYGVWIGINGTIKFIILDDFFPCSSNSGPPLYTRPSKHQIWGLLLEKAYARIYGGYSNIAVGYAGDALKDLTGAPSQYIDLKNPNKAWEELFAAKKAGFPLCAASKEGEQVVHGLVPKHSYAIVDLHEIKDSKTQKIERFLKLQNPLQNSQNSFPCPSSLFITEEEQNTGIFWLPFNDFLLAFEVVTSSKLHPGYFYSFLPPYSSSKHEAISSSSFSFFLIRIVQKTHCYVSLHQKHERLKDANYFYSMMRLTLIKLEEKKEKWIEGNFGVRQTCFLEAELNEGNYLGFGELDKPDEEMVVSVYSSKPVVIERVTRNDLILPITEIMNKIIIEYIKMHPKIGDMTTYSNEIRRIHGTLWGFVYFFYENASHDISLYENVNLIKSENIKIMSPYKNDQNFEIECNPQEYKLVLYKIGYQNNGSHSCKSSSIHRLSTLALKPSFLLSKAIKEGVKTDKIPNEVFFYTYKYEGGTIFVYENKQKQTFKENFVFTILENLKIFYLNEQNEEKIVGKNILIQVEGGKRVGIRTEVQDKSVKRSGYKFKTEVIF